MMSHSAGLSERCTSVGQTVLSRLSHGSWSMRLTLTWMSRSWCQRQVHIMLLLKLIAS